MPYLQSISGTVKSIFFIPLIPLLGQMGETEFLFIPPFSSFFLSLLYKIQFLLTFSYWSFVHSQYFRTHYDLIIQAIGLIDLNLLSCGCNSPNYMCPSSFKFFCFIISQNNPKDMFGRDDFEGKKEGKI